MRALPAEPTRSPLAALAIGLGVLACAQPRNAPLAPLDARGRDGADQSVARDGPSPPEDAGIEPAPGDVPAASVIDAPTIVDGQGTGRDGSVNPSGQTCGAGTRRCGDRCLPESVAACGGSCMSCSSTDNTSVACVAGACVHACLDGFGACDAHRPEVNG